VLESEESAIDPFLLYGLDSDPAPQRGDPSRPSATRDIPPDAWDAFIANSLDRVNLSDDHFAAFRGHNANYVPRLPSRLSFLAAWVTSVANQPATIWWAVQQQPLNVGLQNGIAWWLGRRDNRTSPEIRQAWRYLLAAWKVADDANRKWFELKNRIEQDGWSSATARAFGELTCPYVRVSPAFMANPVPPKAGGSIRKEDLIRLEVECPAVPGDAVIPDAWLENVLRGFRKNIEIAVRLCEEVNDRQRFHIGPIVQDDSSVSSQGRPDGLSACVKQFASLFERLVDLDLSKAKHEIMAWPSDDDTAFCRLRIWAAGQAILASPEEFCEVLNELSDAAFWSDDHQRDLMLVLAERWPMLPSGPRGEIEKRLLEGPPK
jgi:hypothetical protein